MAQPTPHQTIQLPFAKSHAFIIGINDYQTISSLTTAVNDAKGMAQRLEEQHGFIVHEPLLNARKQDIQKWLAEDIPNAVGPNDRIVLYFAGHGIALDSETGPNGYLVPADANAGDAESLIPMEDFHKMLNALPCKHGLLILDCCFAGAFKWSSGFRDVVFDLPSVMYEERFWRYVKDPAWQVITSSAYDQKAVDVLSHRSLGLRETENNSEHSPFAQALFEALEGEGDLIPKGKGNGVITATELYMYLRDKVETQTTGEAKRQTPALFQLSRHDKGEFIFFHPKHRLNLPPAPDRNPFKGLASFDEGDAPLFFGRESVVEALREKIAGSPLLVVSGASGTGKSSVVKAGLLPQLRKEGWHIMKIIRPGKSPQTTLHTELPDAEKQFKYHPRSVLVIDQYEELITQTIDPVEGKAFEAQLAAWLQAFPDLRIVLSIRSDFEPQFEESALTPWWNAGRYIVPSFSLDEIRDVIVKPANQEVLFYEPEELIDKLVEEVNQAPGALPLLSFTLSELYEAYLTSGRSDRALIEADYAQLGGVIGALRTRADATYESLDDAHQNSMRKLMLRMASLEGGELAGKRVDVSELEFSDKAETRRMQYVSKKLVEARLILSGKDGQGKVYVEPAHDALVRAWARLWEWIKTTGEVNINLHSKLALAAEDYYKLADSDAKKAKNLLWNNNPSLGLLHAELKGKDHPLNAKEELFVKTSVKRRSSRKRNVWLIAIAVIIGLSSLTVYSFIQQGIAKEQEQFAIEQTKLAEEREQEAIKQGEIAKAEALNAKLRSYLAESRANEEKDPLLAFRYAEAGYDSTKAYNQSSTDFRDQLIKLVYSKRPFSLVDKGGYDLTEIQKTGPALNHQLKVEGNKIIETDQAGKLVHEYTETPYFSGEASFSPNGKYIITILHDNIPFYSLFKYQGEKLTDNNGIVGFGVAGEEGEGQNAVPFLFDQNNKAQVVFNQEDNAILYTGEFRRRSQLPAFGGQSSAMALSPSGEYFAAGSARGLVTVSKINSSSFEGHRVILEFIAHFDEEIAGIGFCNNETVLKTSTRSFRDGRVQETKYWQLKNHTLGFRVEGVLPYKEETRTFQDPFTQNKVTFQIQRSQSGKKPYKYSLNTNGLYSEKNETLIKFDFMVTDLDPPVLQFSTDGRYLMAGASPNPWIYPIDPALILDLVNTKKAFGELPEVSIEK